MTKIIRQSFGHTKDGKRVDQFILTNEAGASVSVLNYGATIQSVLVPDRDGKLEDVVLGCDSMQDYEKQNCYFGAVIGRYANRMGGSRFSLNGKSYLLEANEGRNSLHGGFCGFDKKIWDAAVDGERIICRLISPDGDGGFPGEMQVTVVYCFDDDNRLTIDYTAVCDADTICNLTNHSYFNLGGKGDILSHMLEMNASRYTQINNELLPTGILSPVNETPFDFLQPKAIGAQIQERNTQIQIAGGYDHNFVLDSGQNFACAAKVYCPASGRTMTVETDMPGVQFYSGNFIKNISGKKHEIYQKHSGFCLETQMFPDSTAHPEFPSTVIRKDEKFHSCTVYQFGVCRDK